MKKRFLSMLLAAAMVAGLLPQVAITAKAAGGAKTSVDAVAEMTWGANLADLYMADIQPSEGATNGYDDFTQSPNSVWQHGFGTNPSNGFATMMHTAVPFLWRCPSLPLRPPLRGRETCSSWGSWSEAASR